MLFRSRKVLLEILNCFAASPILSILHLLSLNFIIKHSAVLRSIGCLHFLFVFWKCNRTSYACHSISRYNTTRIQFTDTVSLFVFLCHRPPNRRGIFCIPARCTPGIHPCVRKLPRRAANHCNSFGEDDCDSSESGSSISLNLLTISFIT